MQNQNELIVKIALDGWNQQIDRTNELLNELTDEQLQNEVSPGRNTGVYLLGHLAAVHDALFPLMGIGEKLFPQLDEIFIKNPDKSGTQKPSAKDLRNYWKQVNDSLSLHFKKFNNEEWFEKHTSINEEDFKKEPHRNRLNVLLSRTSHLSYHRGQLVFLKK